MENNANFAPNARAMQEQMEEKLFGYIAPAYYNDLINLTRNTETLIDNIIRLRERIKLPFLATDRNVLNLPGVGKSLTYRVIGITRYGRRILEFDHDRHRFHSPIIHQMGKVVIIESKSIQEYLNELEAIGEDRSDYEGIFGYSMGETERRMPVYEYPPYNYSITDKLTNFQM